MALAIPNSDSEHDEFDARRARVLAAQSQRLMSSVTEEDRVLRQAIAEKFIQHFLQQIRKDAGTGQTSTECKLRDRQIPVEHREEVIQMIKQQMDELGFNVLSYARPSWIGALTIFQVEW